MTDQPPPDNPLPAAISRAVSAAGYWLPEPGCDAAAQAVAADLDTARRRTVALVERIDAGRAWARQHLTAEQQTGLLEALAGRDSDTILATRDTELDRMRADRDRWQHGLEAAEAQLERLRRTVATLQAGTQPTT